MNRENVGHATIIQNWIDAISKGTPLLTPGEEGVKALNDEYYSWCKVMEIYNFVPDINWAN